MTMRVDKSGNFSHVVASIKRAIRMVVLVVRRWLPACVSLSHTVGFYRHIHLQVTPKTRLHPWTLLWLWYKHFNLSQGDLHLYGKSENVQSELCNCEAGLQRKQLFFSSFKFFFQQLEAFPLWVCDLPNGSKSSGSHNHSPQLLQVSAQSTWPPAAPELGSSSIWWLHKKRLAEFKGLWACPEQWMHRNWLFLPGTKSTLGAPLVKPWQLRTPRTPGKPRHSDDPPSPLKKHLWSR